MPERKVYVVNNSGHDFSPAREYGELIFLSEGMMNSYNLNKMYRIFAPILENSNPKDWILMSGLPQMNVIAASIFAYKHGRINLLLYSSSRHRYDKREIILGNLIKENKNDRD